MPKTAAQVVTHELIAKLAYWYWQKRTENDIAGDALADWLWAENELLGGFRPEGWEPNTLYLVHNHIIDLNNHNQFVVSPGTSGTTEPIWNKVGGITREGTAADELVWQDFGEMVVVPD